MNSHDKIFALSIYKKNSFYSQLCALIICLYCLGQASTAYSQSVKQEIIQLVQEYALYQPSDSTFLEFKISENIGDINNFLQSFDKYASHMDANTLRNIKESSSILSAGVGMDLVYNAQGEHVCIPYVGGVAHQGGVSYGDVLIGIDNHLVPDDLTNVAILIRGMPNTYVQLRLKKQDNSEIIVTLPRAPISPPSVQFEKSYNSEFVIHIYRFDHLTLKQLKNILKQNMDKHSIIIDLRGNVGGSVKAAIECLKLFLPSYALLLYTEDKNKQQSQLYTNEDGQYANLNVQIWQDALSASASELFIAGMTQFGTVHTLGQTSGGKARLQQNFILSDGSRLSLTTKRLLFVDGSDWQTKGIKPNVFLDDIQFLNNNLYGDWLN